LGRPRYAYKQLVTRREKIDLGIKQNRKYVFSLKVDCVLNRSFFYKFFLLYRYFFLICYANFQSIIPGTFSFFILSLSDECFVFGLCTNINVRLLLFFSGCHELQIRSLFLFHEWHYWWLNVTAKNIHRFIYLTPSIAFLVWKQPNYTFLF
jgi:hypothetical protein